MARDVAALLVLSHAPFLSEVCARRTLVFTVAVVKHWVVALVSSCAHAFALWWLCATGDWRVQDSEPTVTRQLIKTGLPAGLTVSTVTRILAAVEATVELVAADQGALVIHVHATQLAALVSAAGAFLVAALLTSEDELFFFLDRHTWDILGLGATSTSDSGGQGAGPTAVLVAQLVTQMDGVAGATGQGLVAGLSTGGDGVRAASSLSVTQLQEFGQRRLTAGARLHQARGARTRLARAAVALQLTPVSFAVKHLPTQFLTGEMSRTVKSVFISATQGFPSGNATVAHLLNLQRAGLTFPAVAHLGAAVFSTVE